MSGNRLSGARAGQQYQAVVTTVARALPGWHDIIPLRCRWGWGWRGWARGWRRGSCAQNSALCSVCQGPVLRQCRHCDSHLLASISCPCPANCWPLRICSCSLCMYCLHECFQIWHTYRTRCSTGLLMQGQTAGRPRRHHCTAVLWLSVCILYRWLTVTLQVPWLYKTTPPS